MTIAAIASECASGRVAAKPDGSIVGANLGVNPSLTITAQAELACSRKPPKAAKEPGRRSPSG